MTSHNWVVIPDAGLDPNHSWGRGFWISHQSVAKYRCIYCDLRYQLVGVSKPYEDHISDIETFYPWDDCAERMVQKVMDL